jgi:NAD(P) transhydrogenase subunit alpha
VRDEKVVTDNGVTILGYTDLPSRLATTASQLYGTNMCHLLSDMGGANEYRVDFEDEVVRGATVLKDGELTWPPPPPPEPKKAPAKPAAPEPKAIEKAPEKAPEPKKAHGHGAPSGPSKVAGPGWWAGLAVLMGGWLFLRLGVDIPADHSTTSFLSHMTVFVLACFVGWQVVWSVTPALHTPLMSVTNAISGVIVVGGMLHAHGDGTSAAALMGMAAVLLATINIAGGFLVTQRMLKMFRK